MCIFIFIFVFHLSILPNTDILHYLVANYTHMFWLEALKRFMEPYQKMPARKKDGV